MLYSHSEMGSESIITLPNDGLLLPSNCSPHLLHHIRHGALEVNLTCGGRRGSGKEWMTERVVGWRGDVRGGGVGGGGGEGGRAGEDIIRGKERREE